MPDLLAFVVFVGVTFWGNSMASVRTIENSPFWQAKLRWMDSGVPRETLRSTKISTSQPASVALAVAQEMEAILRASPGEVGNDDFEKLLTRLLHAGGRGASTPRPAFATIAHDWLAALDVKESTRARYCTGVQLFKDHLGPLAKVDMRKITFAHLTEFHAHLLKQGRSANTAALLLKPIKAIFRQAHALQIIQSNPASVLRLKSARKTLREPFTPDDVEKIFAHLKKFPEWELAARLGSLFGMRIKDAISRRYEEIQTVGKHRCLIFIPEKRERCGKPVTLPLVGPLADLEGEGYLTPKLRTLRNPSRIFSKHLAAAGVVMTRSKSRGKGISMSSKSFHSFRHTLNSALAMNGVDISLRQAICGHDSLQVSLGYTHADVEKMASAISQGIINAPKTEVPRSV
jgi:integrase